VQREDQKIRRIATISAAVGGGDNTTIYRCCMWGDYFLKLLFDELILKFFDGDFEGF
jgi:hypothetical protein